MEINLQLSELFKLKRIAYAMSREKTRYYLNGVCVRKLSPDRLLFVATNGHELAQVVIMAQHNLEEEVILHREFITAITKIKPIRGTDPVVSLQITGFKAELHINNDTISGQLVDGTFPETERVFPSAVNMEVSYNPKYLINICKAIIAGGGKTVTLQLDSKEAQNVPGLVVDKEGGKYLIMPKRC